MTFPVYFNFFGKLIHPHPVMETIAYVSGFRLFLHMRRNTSPAVNLSLEKSLTIFTFCLFGAFAGAKLLAWLEAGADLWMHRNEMQAWVEGKTIVGGLIGGWVGVELAKKRIGVFHSVGDIFVFPLILGMSIGRIGCFLTGLEDHTYGVETGFPFGVDFGDGISRHPTQLYDIAFLAVLALLLRLRMRRPYVNGYIFRVFMLGYFLWRLMVEFIKPRHSYAGLSAIQFACLGAAAYCTYQLTRIPALEKQDGQAIPILRADQ